VGEVESSECASAIKILGVIAGHSRPKDGVASLAYDPAIHDEMPVVITVRMILDAPPHGPTGQARG
jgi:hypothetical protein